MSRPITAVIIGNEILAGRRQDAHLANTVSACNKRKLRLHQAIFLGDNTEDLIQTYQRLHGENHIILSYGGIGATPDDRTRQAVAKACGVGIEYHPEGMKILERRFGEDLTENRKNLVAFPQGSTLIPNPINEIPGFSIAHIHCVPGFPQMAEPMMNWVLDKYYRDMAQAREYRALMVQAHESEIAPLMEELEQRYPMLAISSLPQIRHELELGIEGEPNQVDKALAEAKVWLANHEMPYQA